MFKHSAQFSLGLIVVLFASTTSRAPAEEPIQIAISGFHVAAEKVNPGSDWWGIFSDGKGFALQPTEVKVEAVSNPLDGDDTVKSASMISLPDGSENIVLVRGLKSAAAGSLKSLELSKYKVILRPGASFELPALPGDSNDALRISASGTEVVTTTKNSSRTQHARYELHLSLVRGDQTVTQLLATLPEFESEYGPSLRWAGDLDRDGKLDLLYDLCTDEVSTDLALFLSSAAREGEIVGLVARWHAASNC
jgi:hypothetical protein